VVRLERIQEHKIEEAVQEEEVWQDMKTGELEGGDDSFCGEDLCQ